MESTGISDVVCIWSCLDLLLLEIEVAAIPDVIADDVGRAESIDSVVIVNVAEVSFDLPILGFCVEDELPIFGFCVEELNSLIPDLVDKLGTRLGSVLIDAALGVDKLADESVVYSFAIDTGIMTQSSTSGGASVVKATRRQYQITHHLLHVRCIRKI